MKTVFDFSATDLKGAEQALEQYQGKVLLIVNTASKCGFTPQYEGLEALWEKYAAQGLVVLGFPCNQFGHQEPGTSEQIASFCDLNYGVSFPMFGRIDVNGAAAHPLFAHLKKAAPGLLGTEAIKWNFTKFLVNRKGEVVARFASKDRPASIENRIQSLLAESV
ncbi:Glutathione peroxidase [gamma proteobacterium HdN1]|nr:Glutathione peroxidase [gamma proteobacterium HdN1]